jgi:protein-S-isoprenylcysteine O-methyltransferase Ste14
MIAPGTFLGFLWLGWLLSWVIASRWSAKTLTRGSRRDQLRYSVPTWVGSILVFARPEFMGSLLRPLYPHPTALGWTAAGLVIVGLGWTWWARIHLGKLWSAVVAVKSDHAVIRSGPYGLTRHPIYTGILLAVLATAIFRDSPAAFLGFGLIVAGFVIKLRQEERLLIATLGPEYTRYQSEVAALVPRPW